MKVAVTWQMCGLFQFLIGTVLPEFRKNDWIKEFMRFQFLIGTVLPGTLSKLNFLLTSMSFNSL